MATLRIPWRRKVSKFVSIGAPSSSTVALVEKECGVAPFHAGRGQKKITNVVVVGYIWNQTTAALALILHFDASS